VDFNSRTCLPQYFVYEATISTAPHSPCLSLGGCHARNIANLFVRNKVPKQQQQQQPKQWMDTAYDEAPQ